MTRLTPRQAALAKRLLKIEGKSQREVARILGVSQVAICHLNRGRTHKAVPWPLRKGEAEAVPRQGWVSRWPSRRSRRR
jgi:transcriptional regulator with XRE-family HTH domain